MGFFSKNNKKEDTPTLPALPPLPDLNLKSNNTSSNSQISNDAKRFSLPSLPNSAIGQKMNQNIVKDAVNPIDKEDYDVINPQQQMKQVRTQEINEFPQKMQPSMFTPQEKFGQVKIPVEKQKTMEMSDWEPTQRQRVNPLSIRKSEPLFIKLEKFETTISTFNEIKMKVSEIESLLKNIREIKIKEEKELSEWEKEITEIKARLEQIDKEVFKLY